MKKVIRQKDTGREHIKLLTKYGPYQNLFKILPLQALSIIVMGLLTFGCASQTDLTRIQKELETQIAKNKEEMRTSSALVEEAKVAISESQALISQQKADMAKMRSDLAPLNQQVKRLREQDLTSLYGKNEVAEKRIGDLEKSLQRLEKSLQHINDSGVKQGELDSIHNEIRFLKTNMGKQEYRLLLAESILKEVAPEKWEMAEVSLQRERAEEDTDGLSPYAQMDMGEKYYKGLGVIQDYTKAAQWYQLAANQGYAHGQYELGLLYKNGHGVEQSDIQAHLWLNLSAAQGWPGAAQERAYLEKRMPRGDIDTAQRLAREWLSKHQK